MKAIAVIPGDFLVLGHEGFGRVEAVGPKVTERLVESCDRRRIALRGLSGHQLRILRYLGAGLSTIGMGTER